MSIIIKVLEDSIKRNKAYSKDMKKIGNTHLAEIYDGLWKTAQNTLKQIRAGKDEHEEYNKFKGKQLWI